MLLLLQVLPTSLTWTTTVRRLTPSGGARPPQLTAVTVATARSLPARYLPGSIWYAASRATLLSRSHGTPASVLATTAALELALTLATAIAAGSALLLVGGREVTHPALLVTAAVVAVVAASPPVVNRVLALVARRRGTAAVEVSWPDVGAVAGLTVVHWTWSTGSFLLFLLAFPSLSDAPLATLAGAYLASWAIGFLSVLAPQGAGVFEVALAATLAATAATGVATPSAAVLLGGHRALVVVRDVILALAANGWARRTAAPEGSTPAKGG